MPEPLTFERYNRMVTDLLVGLRERGLDVTRPVLAVLDGSTLPVRLG
jgi:hypothetical protein